MSFQILKISIVILGIFFYSSLYAMEKSSPTGKDLLESCQSFISSASTEMQQMLCTWYVLPCDCEQKDKNIPRVCLPKSVNEKDLAVLIVNELTLDKFLQQKTAAFAANTILQNYYPCNVEE